MAIRLFIHHPLAAHTELALPATAARHAQVRRVQPGDTLLLFDGQGSDWPATVLAVGRSDVRVAVGAPQVVSNELPIAITLALGMPANERMDTLVEKATELGVAQIQPLLMERSVLRLSGERAARKQAHWQAIAQAACEQCGRARVPHISSVMSLSEWLHQPPAGQRWVLSLQAGATQPANIDMQAWNGPLAALSGPEGGLGAAEENAAVAAGFVPVALGPRVLRADTAPLALLAWLGLAAAVPKVG